MEQHPRYKSAPQLQKLDDITYVIVDVSSKSDDEYTEMTEDDQDMSELDEERGTDVDNKSASGESVGNTLLTPDVHSYMSESDASPILRRKKRQAPLPPDMSPTMAARHSYAFDLKALRTHTSTDTESSTDSRFFYQTSTDSETFVLPESARGSNFPGELAGIDNFHSHSSLRPRSADTSLIVSPRGLSKLHRLRKVFLSPQIVRRKTMREKSSTQNTPRIRKTKDDDGFISRTKKSKEEDGSKLSKTKKIRHFEPLPKMSCWILIGGSDDLARDQEFEVTRIPDYENFLSALLEQTDPSHLDYEEISRCLGKVRSMMKENEDSIKNDDCQEAVDVVGERTILPNDDSLDTNAAAANLTTDNIDITNHNIVSTSNNNIVSTSNNNIVSTSNNNNIVEIDKKTTKSRGLSLRRRSAPSAVLFKSLSGSKSRSANSIRYNTSPGKRDHDIIAQFKLADGDPGRMFVTEGSVQFAAGMQVQDRYLFLFSDLLLVTKQKSNTTFKLKNKVHLCDMWIASCLGEVSETTVPTDRSFVLGWPITNFVATFPNTELKDDWLSNLRTLITNEKMKDEDKTLQLHVSLRDIESTTSRHCQMTINNLTQVTDVVQDCLRQINISESKAEDYQLWGLAGKEGSPYPLIGHETPFSIKRSQVRELSRSKSGNDLDNMTSEELDTVVENIPSGGQKCEFYLQQKKPQRKHRFEDASPQKQMKKNKRTKFLNTIFRKKRTNQRLVFGLPLADICDENLDPPEAVIKLMVLVYQQGPHTPGILRKSNNVALGRDIREKIDSGEKFALEDHMALTAASVFKEFLRFLPDGLLMSSFHEQWLTVNNDDPYEDKINKIKTILAKIPPVNYHMIKLTVCLLQHLAKYSSENQMGPSNLATCIAPSLYAHEVIESPDGKLKGDVQKQMQESISEIRNIIVPLVAFMITNHIELFGEDTLSMFVKYGCQVSPVQALDDERYDGQMQPSAEEDEDSLVGEEEDNFSGQCSNKQLQLRLQKPNQHGLKESNSGTDSDSMHSVLSMQDAPMGLQRDDSSIDSLGEREFFTHESPKAVKSHLSPTNLSRDSGLTLSDNQLYDEEAIYQAEIASTSAKIFHQRAPHYTDPDAMDTDDHSSCSNNADCLSHKIVSPVAPPRRLSVRKKMSNVVGSNARQYGINDFSTQQVPLRHSASATHLDDSQNLIEHRDRRPLQTHSSLDKRVSVNSIGDEQEAQNIRPRPMDFLRMSERTDIGTLIKSESGTHLFLNEGTLPTDICLGSSENATDHNFLRLSSVGDTSLPVSPESRHSQSSCDSVISNSTYSCSRDGSVNSAPLTPDEPQDTSLNWVPDITLPDKPWQGMFASGLNTQKSYTSSKSTSDIPSRKDENYDSENSINLNFQNMLPGKANEAEEVEMINRPQVSLFCKSSDIDVSMDTTSHSSQAFHARSIPSGKQRHTHVGSGSPPPRVILQTQLRTGCNSPPRRSSVDSFEPRRSDTSFDMQSMRHEDYINATSRPIIISSENSLSNSASSATTRARLSKYIRHDLPLSLKDNSFVPSKSRQLPPDMLPNYQQMIKRNVMKCDMPDDVTENQIEISARARKMYELSLLQYNEEIRPKPSDIQLVTTRSNLNLVANSGMGYTLKSKSEKDDTMTNSLASNDYADNTLSDYAANCSFQQEFSSDNPDDSGASGFLDMGSISHSLQEDIVSRRTTHAEMIASSVKRSISPESLTSLSRNGSKLSDSGSSSSSSVTISSLSKHSDSFGRHSDLSNTSSVTVSSVTSSDSNPEANSVGQRLKNVTRFGQHSSPKENIRVSNTEIDKMQENKTDVDDLITLKKDPQEVYIQSWQIYEQNASSGISSLASTQNKPSPILPSFHPQQQYSDNMLEQLQHTETPKQVNTPQGRAKESKTRLNAEFNNFNLHRSRSDSSEHVHKLSAFSSRSPKSGHDDSENSKEVPKASSEDVKVESLPRDIKSELHESFMKARSCFHQPAITESPSSARSSHSTSRFVHRSPSALDTRSSNWPHPALSPTAAANTTAALPPPLKSNTSNLPAGSSSQENKKEFHWSVKDLKSKYDKDNSRSGEPSYKPTSYISQSRPNSPPPYQNPPSFRQPDNQRHSISSSSSSDNDHGTNKISPSHRQGPQSYVCTSSHGTYSCGSSPDRQSWLSSSSLDEELSDYTNTTYI